MTHEERVYHHLYETMAVIAEQSERIASLEKLVADLWEYIYIGTAQDVQSLHDRTRELGIEVDE